MNLDLYVVKEGKNLRCGYTTGSCATAAAKAATIILEKSKEIKYVEIDTPANIELKLEVHEITIEKDYVSCAIIKDGGDDPDKTDGMKIYAKVSRRIDENINIDGGVGIGRITRKGLFGEVGEAAINPVPRKMIEKAVKSVGKGGYDVLIYAPQGEIIGKKTFNSKIGIEGGISILGTSGIVYPMSEEALLKTIYMEVDMIEQIQGTDHIVLVPGNYGDTIAKEIGILEPGVKISNFIGDSLLYLYNKGFKSVTLIGHIGKFSKLSIGIFNTHSKASDTRMEAFIYYLALMGVPIEILDKLNNTLTAEEAIEICVDAGYGKVIKAMEKGAEDRIRRYLKDDDFEVKVIIYSMRRGVDIC